MAYIKTEWENSPSTKTPINANNLNKIENGIYMNSVNIGELTDLNTETKETLVGAINENNEKIGNLNSLTTTVKSNLTDAINEINTKVIIDPLSIFDSTKLELKTTDNKNEITVINNKIVIINLTFKNLVKFTSKTYVDIGNITGLGINPSKNFLLYGVDSTNMNLGFGYYQSYSGNLRFKFASDCAIGSEIDIHAVYTLD